MPENQTAAQDPRNEFINASVWHGSFDRAHEVLAAHPEVASSDIHTAALLGDHEAVARFLAEDLANATVKGGPRKWDALTHLCFSRFLRLEPARTEGFLKAATALLDAGANPNTGFFEENHAPKPEWECALYGAAGVAHHPELTWFKSIRPDHSFSRSLNRLRRFHCVRLLDDFRYIRYNHAQDSVEHVDCFHHLAGVSAWKARMRPRRFPLKSAAWTNMSL